MLGLGVSVAGICEGVASDMFVGLECVNYLVNIIVMPGYAETFYVWVSTSRE